MVAVVKILTKLGPFAAKNVPKLWPLLLESKNRERVMQAASDLASQSPRKRLQARAELTAELAASISEDAADAASQQRAQDWSRRARDIARLLDMPVQGRDQRKRHRAQVRGQLDALQGEMNEYLSRSTELPPA